MANQLLPNFPIGLSVRTMRKETIKENDINLTYAEHIQFNSVKNMNRIKVFDMHL